MVDVILASLVAALVPFTVIPPDPSIDSGVAPPASCATYSIEGSLDGAPSAQSGADIDTKLEISATAYLHDGGEPLVGHRVIAVFDMAEGVAPVDPLLTVTDGDGRVSIVLPVGAIGVSFRAESAASGNCPDVAPGDVPVVTVDVAVLPPGFGSASAPAAAGSTLPVTGPRETLVLVAGLILAVGLGTVASRSRRTTEEPGGVPR